MVILLMILLIHNFDELINVFKPILLYVFVYLLVREI